MAGFQQIVVMGNLGADPEVRTTASGDSVVNLSIATSESWTSSDGNQHERTEWHRAVFWRKSAETIAQYFSKGMPILVVGKMRTNKFTNKEGQDVETKEIDGISWSFCSPKNGNGNGQTRSLEPAYDGAGSAADISFDTSDF